MMGASPTADIRQTDPLAPANIILFLALLALMPLMGTLFGYGSQAEQLPIVERLRDPNFLTGDFYVNSAAQFGPRIYYAHVLAWLHDILPLPLITHSLAVLCNFALASVTYYAATRLLYTNALGGLLAAVFVVTNGSFSLGLAGYLRFESFQPANPAIPLALIGMVLLIKLQPFWALGPLILSALAHPLIGMEIALIAYCAIGLSILLRPPEAGVLRSFAPAVVSGFLFAIAMYLVWILPMSGTNAIRMSDTEFFETLAQFRSPHHYLGLSFPQLSWMQALAFVGCAGIVLALHQFRHGFSREVLALSLAALIVLALCAVSLWFVDMMQSRLWVTAQVFRMLMVVKWVGLLAFGWLVADWIDRDRLAGITMAGCLALATADAQPYAIVFALISAGALVLGPRWVSGPVWSVIRWAGLGVLILMSVAAQYRYGLTQQSLRALLALAALALIAAPRPGKPIGAALATLLVAVTLTTTALTREKGLWGLNALQAQLVWADLTGDNFEISRAASELSPPDAIWLVPPDFESFRIISGRAIVVDHTSIPFDDAAMREWRTRMEAVHGPINSGGFTALREMARNYRNGIDWIAVAQRYGADYAVLYAETPWPGAVLFENSSFKAVRLNGPEQ
ncbi:DUF6798 domain-containing protein [Ruegeria meonggei]|uniref:DUF6798 domain-containing protein n=1 Tax=Ruegeria meonggei TaxID=1446476 RepID=A0A1X7ACX0_9RHOB|nr:DUF6798 domain-containing protein [Ruegeria meonggei]SLN75964.1 hypothetical protein RUM8411_04301 [Ruegeria meonggei]